MAGSLEIRLFNLIRELHQEIADMKPEGGFSSPRDLELVTEVNKKSAVFDKLQEAMRIYNPDFKYEPKQESKKDLFLYYGEAPFKIDLGFDDLVDKGLVIIFNNNTQIRFRLSDVVLKADNENI